MKLKNFFSQFPNPWALRVSGMGGYTSKCEKKSKSLHPNKHPTHPHQRPLKAAYIISPHPISHQWVLTPLSHKISPSSKADTVRKRRQRMLLAEKRQFWSWRKFNNTPVPLTELSTCAVVADFFLYTLSSAEMLPVEWSAVDWGLVTSFGTLL